MQQLVILAPDSPHLPFPIEAGKITIGRHPDNTVVLSDASVSSFHAELVADDGGTTLTDLGSSNGTTVNGRRIQTQLLRAGDRIFFASVGARYEEVATSSHTILPEALPEVPKGASWYEVALGGEKIRRFEDARQVRAALVAGQINRRMKARFIYQKPEAGTEHYELHLARWMKRTAWRPIGDGLAREDYAIESLYDPLGAVARRAIPIIVALVVTAGVMGFIFLKMKTGLTIVSTSKPGHGSPLIGFAIEGMIAGVVSFIRRADHDRW